MSFKSFLLLSAVVTATVLCPAGVEASYYDVTLPTNLRNGSCTPRCQSTSSAGAWRCDKVITPDGLPATVCNTFELAEDTHSCHYHYFTQKEVAACLGGKSVHLMFLGGSHASALSWTLHPWFDPVVQANETYDAFKWFAAANVNGTYNITKGGMPKYDISSNGLPDWNHLTMSHAVYTSQGVVKWKLGLPSSKLYDTMDALIKNMPSRVAGQWSMSHMNLKSFDKANTALNTLKKYNRQARTGYVYVALGAWTIYAYKDCAQWCTAVGGDAVAIRQLALNQTAAGLTAVFKYIKDNMNALADRVATEFPNYTLFIADTPGLSSGTSAGLTKLLQEVVAAHPKTNFLAATNMLKVAANHEPAVNGHGTHMFNHAVFNRMLSVTCNSATDLFKECEEEIIMETTCQEQTFSAVPHAQWWEEWYRPCDYNRYT